MTDEEISALQARISELEKTTADLTVERDSLKDELSETNESLKKSLEMLAETKKLNFTLARQLDAKPKTTFEETLLDAMGVKR